MNITDKINDGHKFYMNTVDLIIFTCLQIFDFVIFHEVYNSRIHIFL